MEELTQENEVPVMPLLNEHGDDRLARFRNLAPEPRARMSHTAAAKLRAVNENDRATKAANAKFAAQFARLPKDTWTIVQVLARIYSADNHAWTVEATYDGDECTVTPVRKVPLNLLLERMANKVICCLRQGWTVTEPHDITLFGALTAEERAMSDEKFITHLDRIPSKVSLSRYNKDGLKQFGGAIKAVVVPSGRRCALRSQCMRAENRLGAWVTGKSKYCSKMCLGRAKAFEQAGKALPAD
jgi:hypothetical protein